MSSIATPVSKSARQHALQHLGTDLPASVNTAADAMKHGNLTGWNLRKSPLVTKVGNLTLTVPDSFAVIRDSPFKDGQVDVLASVGRAYKVMQHEKLAPLLDTLAEDAGATFETAGTLDGGRRVFVTLKMPRGAKVAGKDPVDIYLSAFASHDGETSTSLMVTPVRVRCQSTLNLSYGGALHLYKVRHYAGSDQALHTLAREAMDFTYDYVDKLEEQAGKLARTPLTQGGFEAFIARHFGAPDDADKRTVTRTQNKLYKMADLFSDSFATEAGGTAWAGLAALTEWHDHHSPVRSTEYTEDVARSRKALLDPRFKNTALRLMGAL